MFLGHSLCFSLVNTPSRRLNCDFSLPAGLLCLNTFQSHHDRALVHACGVAAQLPLLHLLFLWEYAFTAEMPRCSIFSLRIRLA